MSVTSPVSRAAAAYAAHDSGAVLYLDQTMVDAKLADLTTLLPAHTVLYYAIKTNPDPHLLKHLASVGVGMDIASRAELYAALAAGTPADLISYGNTVKHTSDIAEAWAAGVTLFAADSQGELEKIAKAAPGAGVWLRTAVASDGAVFALSHKFGASPDTVPELAEQARAQGLQVHGLSFHVGSQQTTAHAYHAALATVYGLIAQIPPGDVPLTVNIGGGLPAYGYLHPDPGTMPAPLAEYAGTFAHWHGLTSELPHTLSAWAAEPGRFLVADAGVLATRVLDVNRRPGYPDYLVLESGRYSGLDEAELIAPRISAHPRNPTDELHPYIVVGPTCDSADTIGDGCTYELPAGLASGDPVFIHSQGAYSLTCASQNFNGLPNPTAAWLPA